MNDKFFDKVERKTNVSKEDILELAKSLQNKDLKNKDELKKIIKNVASLAGKEVSEKKEKKIIDAIVKDKIPRNIDKTI